MRRALTAAALGLGVAVTAPAAAGEPMPPWLSAIGEFVRDGLAPPRTAEDLFREEKTVAPPKPPPPPAHAAAPPPAPAPAPAAIPAAASVFAPEPVVAPEPAKAAPPKAEAKVEAAVKKPDHSVQPGLRAVVTPAEIKARPVLPVAVRPIPAPPPPEPLTGSRIAATATLDQALKLGGAATLYGQRVNKPRATP